MLIAIMRYAKTAQSNKAKGIAMKYLHSVLLTISVVIFSIASAQAKQLITVGYYEFPPASYTDSANNPAGYTLELGRKLLTRAGYEVAFKALPSARLYAELISGDIDLWLGAPNKPELAGHTLESTRVIGEVTLAVFYHPKAKPPRLPDDLKDKKIILIGGYSYWPPASQWLTDSSLNLKLTRTSQHTSAIAMLMRKRGDYLFDYLEPMKYAQEQLGLHDLSLPYIKIHSASATFILSKQTLNAAKVFADLEAQFDQDSPPRLYQHKQ